MTEVDLDGAGTDRAALARQYASGATLQDRVQLYRFLVPDEPTPAGWTWEGWVLDHHEWQGTERVLDVGCGPGRYLAALAQRAGTLLAVDLSPGMLAEAGAVVPAGRVAGDAVALPLSDACVDVALAAHMLYHVPDIAGALRELRRVLRPGGALIVTLNGSDDKQQILRALCRATDVTVGRQVSTPAWNERCHLDNAGSMLAEVFDSVTEARHTGTFRFPDPDPPTQWVASLRPGAEAALDDGAWGRLLAELRRHIAAEIAERGVWEVTKSSGVLVAR